MAAFNAKQKEVYLFALDKALGHTKIRSSDMLYGKWLFYKAAAQFTDRKLEEALNTLYADNTLLKDKAGWLFGHRLLEIMILMERKDYELIDFRIEALRKLLQRQKHKSITRIKAIFQILHLFVRGGYNYRDTAIEAKSQLELLEGNAELYFWDPLGFETIRFDTWFRAKALTKHTL
ncbi:hypothetical protein BH09BAC1_BH09BAC1_29340 [soil metagenome]